MDKQRLLDLAGITEAKYSGPDLYIVLPRPGPNIRSPAFGPYTLSEAKKAKAILTAKRNEFEGGEFSGWNIETIPLIQDID